MERAEPPNIPAPTTRRPEEMIGFYVDRECGEVRFNCPCGGGWVERWDALDQPRADQDRSCPECGKSGPLVEDR